MRVAVWATDPLTLNGVVSLLRSWRDVVIVPARERCEVDVLVVVADHVGGDVLAALWDTTPSHWVLVTNQVREDDLEPLRGLGVAAVVPKSVATRDRLVAVVDAVVRDGDAAKGTFALPGRTAGPGGARAGLTRRESAVLRLVADGWDTGAIARELRFSERTVTDVIGGMTRRLNLRSQSHAVAYALRTGTI